MDDLTEALAVSFQVTVEPNNPAAPHPRFSQYKSKNKTPGQEVRRQQILERQKNRRFNQTAHVRKLAIGSWEEDEDDEKDDEKQDEEMEVVEQKPGFYYKNQLMLSEWLVEIPEDFMTEWVMMPCPVGKRCLVVASSGTTSVYARSGYCIKRIPSLLPGGNRQQLEGRRGNSILDCIFNEEERTFYIIDLMCWKDNPIYDSETEFRLYWLRTKLEEIPEVGNISTYNPFKFVPLPICNCEQAEMSAVMTTPFPFKLDGILFFHKRTHYTFGRTPLVGWLKPYMLPEMLGLAVLDKYIAEKPSDYTTFNNHMKNIKDLKEQRHTENNASRGQKNSQKNRVKKVGDNMEVAEAGGGDAPVMDSMSNGAEEGDRTANMDAAPTVTR